MIKGWVQSDFPAFAGKTVTLERCHSAAESTNDQASAFHATCNNKGPTVTVIKSAQGYVFGGAIDASWNTDGSSWNAAPGYAPFLFCLKCFGVGDSPAPRQMHMTQKNNDAWYANAGYGPTFGGGFVLSLQGLADGSDGRSYANLGGTYECPISGEDKTTGCKNWMANTDFPDDDKPGFFKVDDFEVFVLKAE